MLQAKVLTSRHNYQLSEVEPSMRACFHLLPVATHKCLRLRVRSRRERAPSQDSTCQSNSRDRALRRTRDLARTCASECGSKQPEGPPSSARRGAGGNTAGAYGRRPTFSPQRPPRSRYDLDILPPPPKKSLTASGCCSIEWVRDGRFARTLPGALSTGCQSRFEALVKARASGSRCRHLLALGSNVHLGHHRF
jgi:hypothetical protein